MKKTIKAMIASCLLLFMTTSMAHTEGSGVSTVGYGTITCGEFSKKDNPSTRKDMFRWLKGYVTGINEVLTYDPSYEITFDVNQVSTDEYLDEVLDQCSEVGVSFSTVSSIYLNQILRDFYVNRQ